jgi:hypothetical protein
MEMDIDVNWDQEMKNDPKMLELDAGKRGWGTVLQANVERDTEMDEGVIVEAEVETDIGGVAFQANVKLDTEMDEGVIVEAEVDTDIGGRVHSLVHWVV